MAEIPEPTGKTAFPAWAWWAAAALAGVLIGLGAIGLTMLGPAR